MLEIMLVGVIIGFFIPEIKDFYQWMKFYIF